MRDPNRYAILLRLRKQTEDLKAQDLATSHRALQRSQRERTSLELTRRSALEQAGKTLLEEFDAAQVRSYYQYERHLATLRDQKDAEIRDLQSIEAEKMEALEKATQARHIAEKLHERRRNTYLEYLDREAQKQLDETATMYAARDQLSRAAHDPK
ncbi:MAG: flagellar FliJ family protein [Candidatus Hydrogenedentes bacterium]|nr:flagellar FliJ family protein [Candidatus Hydrogenedentota bacterium]